MKKNIDERIVRHYMAGEKLRVIAKRCGVPISVVSSRINILREKGVKLPRRHRPRQRFDKADVGRLNAIVRGARRRSPDR